MAVRGVCIFTTLVTFLLMLATAVANDQKSFIARGSTFSTQDDTTTIIVSPNGGFSCGFYKVATNAFTFSIWFSRSSEKTVAWTANRDAPVNGKGSKLTFLKDGSLALVDYDDTTVWSTNTTAPRASRAELDNGGNLIVKADDGHLLWQSFDSPTDTLLPSQPITRNIKLVSASARGLPYSGMYTLLFDTNNMLSLIYNGPDTRSVYWPNPYNKPWDNGRTTYNSSQHAVLNKEGRFIANDNFTFEASDLGEKDIVRRLTLDYDGNIRLYSLNATDGKWSVSYLAFRRVCEIHGVCGKNSFCTYRPSLQCSCLEGFEMVKPTDWSLGCMRKANIVLEQDYNTNNKTKRGHIFRKIPKADFYGYDLDYFSLAALQKCRQRCLEDHNCQAFAYRKGKGECYPKALLINGKKFPDPSNDIYLKFPMKAMSSKGLASTENHACTVIEKEAYPSSQMFKGGSSKFKFGYFLTSALTLLAVEVILITIGCWVVHKWGRRSEIRDEGYNIISNQFRRFNYKELEKATNCFQEELGSGGSGAVYKGILDDQRKVAVKKLNDVVQGEQEFRSELSIIGRVYHMNLVRIWGYCAEKTRKLLVSEFVENGSLGRFLSDHQSLFPVLQWNQRYNIALGVAKGLAYLHHECLEWIVHCDIKPENILLDKDFEPKIADFGLVKLLNQGPNLQILSRVHGTRGYIAPEWALNLPITGKVDVFSYGVVLLELVKGIRVSNWVVEGDEEVEMAVKRTADILKEKLASEDQSWLLGFVDCRLDGEFNYSQAATVLKVAVSCVEDERRRRPSMSSVVEILLSLVEQHPLGRY